MTTLNKIETLLLGSPNLSAAMIAEAINASPSRTREVLAKMVEGGTVTKVKNPTDKIFLFALSDSESSLDDEPAADLGITEAPVEAKPAKTKALKEAKAKVAKVRKERKAPSGRGNPAAKKVVNPQPTLELKKAAIRAAKGKMVWANRKWSITANGMSLDFASRELADMTLTQLCKAFGIPVPAPTAK